VTVVLAHAGPGSTWQAMVVVAGVVLAGAGVLAAVGRLRVAALDDVVVPFATAAVLSSVGLLAHEWLSDAIGWGLPIFVVAAGALLLAALTPLDLRLPAPLPMGATALALVGAVVLYAPLTVALHPPAEVLPLADDAEVAILEPSDEEVVTGATVAVVVAVSGGSIGPGDVDLDDLPADPEEAGDLAVAVAEVQPDGTTAPQERVAVSYGETCTIAAPCSQVRFPLTLEPGTWRVTVEFTRGDGTPLAPYVRDTVVVTVE
jgi:hypothetical protein